MQKLSVGEAAGGAVARGPSTLDTEFILKALAIIRLPLKYIFRIKVEGLENLDMSRPGIIVANQNAGVWGVLNVVSMGYAWYTFLKNPPDCIAQGGKAVFSLPFLRGMVKRAGFVPVSMEGMHVPLRQGKWVFVTPGSNIDQFRPIWQRNRVRFKKVSWVNHRPVLSEQIGYVGIATEHGCPIYPLAISGTHEMSPVIYECTTIDRWLGLRWLRKGEHWASFPITLNHLINLFLFLLTPLKYSVTAWVVFILVNIYIDIVYLYPIFPFRIRLKFGPPVEVPKVEQRGANRREQHKLFASLHAEVVSRMNALHDEIEETRPWRRVLRRLGFT